MHTAVNPCVVRALLTFIFAPPRRVATRKTPMQKLSPHQVSQASQGQQQKESQSVNQHIGVALGFCLSQFDAQFIDGLLGLLALRLKAAN